MAPQGGSWRPGDAQLGSIVENRLDEAHLLSWPGPLEIYVPLHDTGGYDRARAPMGTYDFRLDQIKGTASLHSGNLVRISFNAPALHPRPGLDFVFVYYDLTSRDVPDPIWKVPSVELGNVCDQLLVVAGRSGSLLGIDRPYRAIERRSIRSPFVTSREAAAGPSSHRRAPIRPSRANRSRPIRSSRLISMRHSSRPPPATRS